MPEKKSIKIEKKDDSTTIADTASAKTSDVKNPLTDEKKVDLKPVKDTKKSKPTAEATDVDADLGTDQSKVSEVGSDAVNAEESNVPEKKTPVKKVKLSSTSTKSTEKTAVAKVTTKTELSTTPAEPKPTRTPRVGKNLSPEGNKIYSATASRDYFKKGEIVLFEKVHNWLKHGEEVSAYGKIIDILVLDEDIPYIEVNFNDSDAKKLNKSSEGKSADLGNEIRRFLLEHSN